MTAPRVHCSLDKDAPFHRAIEPEQLSSAAGDNTIVARQSLFRNVVSGDRFLNVYIFGIDPVAEAHVSSFSLTRGRFLRPEDVAVAVLDEASARALGVALGKTFPVRKADGEDLVLTVVGIIGKLRLGPSKHQSSRRIQALYQAASSSRCTQVRQSLAARH